MGSQRPQRPSPTAGGQGSASACAKGPCIGHIPTRHSAVPVGGAASSCAAAPDRPADRARARLKGTLPRPRCPCTRTSGASRHAVPSPSSGRSSSSHRKCYPSATGLATALWLARLSVQQTRETPSLTLVEVEQLEPERLLKVGVAGPVCVPHMGSEAVQCKHASAGDAYRS